MLADPQSVTIDGTPNSLPRVESGINAARYTKDDQTVSLSTSHSYGKRYRRVVRLDHNKISADPLVPAQNQKLGASMYLVFDQPVTGYTAVDLEKIATGFLAWFTASSNANLKKVLAGEP